MEGDDSMSTFEDEVGFIIEFGEDGEGSCVGLVEGLDNFVSSFLIFGEFCECREHLVDLILEDTDGLESESEWEV